jgi:hypothetical protein
MWVPDIGELLFSCSRPSYSPPNQRCRWFVVYGGYAAFDTSPPAIIVVAKADFPIVAHQFMPPRLEPNAEHHYHQPQKAKQHQTDEPVA